METCTELSQPFANLLTKPSAILIRPDEPNVLRVPAVQREVSALNHGILVVQESLGKRVKLRFDCESRGSWSGNWSYKRLRGISVLADCPNAEQAELLIAAVQDFLSSLNGKWLAPKPAEPTGEPGSSK